MPLRLSAVPHRSVIYTTIGFTLMEVLMIVLGFHVFAFYDQLGCDPLRTGQVKGANQVTGALQLSKRDDSPSSGDNIILTLTISDWCNIGT